MDEFNRNELVEIRIGLVLRSAVLNQFLFDISDTNNENFKRKALEYKNTQLIISKVESMIRFKTRE